MVQHSAFRLLQWLPFVLGHLDMGSGRRCRTHPYHSVGVIVMADLKWSDIHLGQNWRHKKTKRVVIMIKTPTHNMGSVKLLHQSGRKTSKYTHYFLYDYELITTEALLSSQK